MEKSSWVLSAERYSALGGNGRSNFDMYVDVEIIHLKLEQRTEIGGSVS